MRAHAELLARVDAELNRRLLPDHELGDPVGGQFSIDGESGDQK